MKRSKKLIAVLLAAIIAFSFSTQAFAKSDSGTGKPYSSFAKVVDNVFGVAHDAIFGLLIKLTQEWKLPKYEDYIKQPHEYFYEGTDGETSGTGWSGGFASGSVIPESWRCDADGNSDPNGMCLKSIHATGGYQTFVSKLYTDQMMSMVILSNGADSNKNGKNDIIVFVSVDGVGITAGTCRDMRKSAEEALKAYGVTADDIVGFNVSATHCHAGLDIQGMCILTLFSNKMNVFDEYDRSLSKDMEESLCNRAKECAKEAYGKIEEGKLYFFETDETSGCNDNLNCGVQAKNFFSCFLFEGNSGEKTILSNIGGHPTSYGAWNNNRMMCTDYPYFMSLALKDAGYNVVFTQSSQAAISSPNIDCKDGDERDTKANEWVAKNALTKEDWVKRYGKKYANKQFDTLEKKIEGHMKKGCLLADFIVDSIDKSLEVKPLLNVKNTQTLLSLDNGVMAWGSISGLLGEEVVKTSKSETGYGVMVETDYIEFGGEIVVLTAPGELSPALVYGTDPDYNGTALWTGTTSWAGVDWKYDTLKNIAVGENGKKFVLMGITNDALGYMYPDICTPKSLLATLIFYKESSGDMANCMLMTVGTSCGSELMDSYTAILKSAK